MQSEKNQITELIKKRVSVRTYNNEELKKSHIKKINDFIKESKGPFGNKVRFKIFNSSEEINGAKLGTYGVIKGTKSFIGVAVEEGDMNLEELGYEMESLVLYATSLGIGTCFLAGTFNKSEFTKAMNLKETEIFPIISPIGYEASKKSIVEKFFRFKNKANARKEWKELFFLNNFKSPIIEKGEAGEYERVLENLRLAPSAMNKQPWRVLKIGTSFHFYINEGKTSNIKKMYNSIQRIDMGIALCHFDLSCKVFGIWGEFINKDPQIEEEGLKYITTWTKID